MDKKTFAMARQAAAYELEEIAKALKSTNLGAFVLVSTISPLEIRAKCKGVEVIVNVSEVLESHDIKEVSHGR